MRFELNRLGSDGFEQMIQSLIQAKERETVICGDGPDGQREFFVRNAQFEVVSGQYARGYTVGQVKYKSPDGKEKDWDWLRRNLKNELDGFRQKQEESPEKVPDTYLFFTNLALTPVADSGLRDKAERFVNSYRDVIENIFLYGADDVRSMLDNNRDVAQGYASFILPGDVLIKMHEYLDYLQCQKMEALIEYVRQMFREDAAVHLEQAGGILERSINIRNVYTDLEVKTEGSRENHDKRIAEYLITLGDQPHRREQKDSEHPWGVTQLWKKHTSDLLLVGNAGQGKSTVCQYICQIYRACLLKRFSSQEQDCVAYFQNTNSPAVPAPKCERFPVMVSLKLYAAWIQKQGAEGNPSVMAYFASLIQKKSASDFQLCDLRSLLRGFSWIFIFDGLDEVPASSNRGEVLNQIHLFRQELSHSSCDSIMIFTSRPQGLDLNNSPIRIRRFSLQEMSKPLCREYLSQLLNALEENSELRERYQAMLLRALEDKTTSRLMTTPLYTAIIVLLVKAGGTPPKKRYKLFQEYCRVVITRELQKELLPLVNGETEWVRELHAKIGFLLQMESENAENAAAELSTSRCKGLIADYLTQMEANASQSDELYRAMVYRLPFLAEVVGDDGETSVLFPLRSIQEYYAAEWLIGFQDDETRLEALSRISVNAYWRNVYLFVNGYYTKSNHRSKQLALQGICRENNGDVEPEIANPEAQSITLQGSRLALDVLQDEPFSRPKDWKPYLELAAKLLDAPDQPLETADRFLALPKCYEQELVTWVMPIVERTKHAGSVAFLVLWGLADRGIPKAVNCLEGMVDIVTMDDRACVEQLMRQGYKGVGERVLIKLLGWVTGECFADCARRHFYREDLYSSFFNYCAQTLDVDVVRSFVARLVVYGRGRIPVHSIALDFDKKTIPECAALDQFQREPVYVNFATLLHTCFALPENVREVFLKLDSWDSDVFLNVIKDATARYSSAEEALTCYNPARFQTILERKKELSLLLEKDDIITFTKEGGWEFGLRADDTKKISNEDLLALLDAVVEHPDQKALGNYIAAQIEDFGRSRDVDFQIELGDWTFRHIPEVIQFHSFRLVLNLFNQVFTHRKKPGDSAFFSIRFPQRTVGFFAFGGAKSLIKDCLTIEPYYPAMIEAYSLVGLCERNREWLRSILPCGIAAYYQKIQEIKNPLALAGYLCCLLVTDLLPETAKMIRGDLTDILNNRENAMLFYWYYREFSQSSKLLIWKIAKTSSAFNSGLMRFLTAQILEDIEHTAINCETLLALSKEGHPEE